MVALFGSNKGLLRLIGNIVNTRRDLRLRKVHSQVLKSYNAKLAVV